MKHSSLALWLTVCVCASASAQDALKRKGVSYWGQPAAQQLYQPPSVPPVRARASQTAAGAARGSAFRNTDHIDFEIMSHGVRRSAIVHIPRGYDGHRPLPVILAFHGLGMHANEMPILTGLNGAGDRNGYLIVYPDAIDRRWDDGFTGADRGDVPFIEDLISRLPQIAPVDTRRVFACGISNGGFFSQRLACDLPGKIAGIAVVAATSYRSVCSRCSAGTIPVMFFNGTEDSLIPFDTSKTIDNSAVADLMGTGKINVSGALTEWAGLLTAPDAVAFWVHHNSAGSPRSSQLQHQNRDACKVALDEYGSGHGAVAAYTIEGGGHTWPGGMPIPGKILGSTAMDVNASEAICRFFGSH